MKKINPFHIVTVAVLSALLALLPVKLMAASATASWSVASTNSLVNGPGSISALTFTATGAVMTVRLIDMPSTTQTYIIGATTNYTPTVYTNTAVYTTPLGSVTNNHLYLTNIPTAVIQTTNNYRTIGVFVVPANDTLTIPYSTVNPFLLGLGYTNVGGGSITVQYEPFK